MPIDKDKALSVVIKQRICATMECKLKIYACSTVLICCENNISRKPRNTIIFYKKFEGNPSTFGRLTVLSVNKENK